MAGNLEPQTATSTRRFLPAMPANLDEVETRAIDMGLSTTNVAKGLGVFSLALGLAEVALTRSLARTTGLRPEYATLLRVFGVREITSGVGLLSGRNQKFWMWSRVAGDVLDVALLGHAFVKAKSPERKQRIAIAAAVVAPIVVMDVINSLRENALSELSEDNSQPWSQPLP